MLLIVAIRANQQMRVQGQVLIQDQTLVKDQAIPHLAVQAQVVAAKTVQLLKHKLSQLYK